jgi:hypothetical protein
MVAFRRHRAIDGHLKRQRTGGPCADAPVAASNPAAAISPRRAAIDLNAASMVDGS